jgi:hypothetical protein
MAEVRTFNDNSIEDAAMQTQPGLQEMGMQSLVIARLSHSRADPTGNGYSPPFCIPSLQK